LFPHGLEFVFLGADLLQHDLQVEPEQFDLFAQGLDFAQRLVRPTRWARCASGC
jgi:hypothetical protein